MPPRKKEWKEGRLKGDTLGWCSRTKLRFPLKDPLSALGKKDKRFRRGISYGQS